MSGATNALYAPLNLNEELMRTLFPTLHSPAQLLTIQTFCHFPLATCIVPRFAFVTISVFRILSRCPALPCPASITSSLAPWCSTTTRRPFHHSTMPPRLSASAISFELDVICAAEANCDGFPCSLLLLPCCRLLPFTLRFVILRHVAALARPK